jgi:hypothetical protein
MATAIIPARLAGVVDRVYPVCLPLNAEYPAVTYRLISAERFHLYGNDANVHVIRIQVDCWAKSYAEVQGLANIVTSRLSRSRGPIAGYTVHDMLLDNSDDDFEPDTLLYRVSQNLRVYLTQ